MVIVLRCAVARTQKGRSFCGLDEMYGWTLILYHADSRLDIRRMLGNEVFLVLFFFLTVGQDALVREVV